MGNAIHIGFFPWRWLQEDAQGMTGDTGAKCKGQDFEALFSEAPDAIVVTDEKTQVLAVNNAATVLLNRSAEVLMAGSLVSFVRHGHRTGFRRRMEHLSRYPLIEDWEVPFKPHGAGPFIASISVKVMGDGRGGPRAFLFSIRDITERKMMEIRLSDHIEKIRRVNETLPDIIYATDRHGRVTFISGATARLLGGPPESFIGEHILAMGGILQISSGALEGVADEIRHCIEQGGDTVEHRLQVEVNGECRFFELKETVHYDGPGDFSGLSGVLRDITERVARDEQYRVLVEQSTHGIVIFQGVPFRFVFVNSEIARLLGYTQDELMAFPPGRVRDLIHPDDRERIHKRYINRLLGNSEELHYRVRFRMKDGAWRELEIFPSRIEYNGRLAIQATCIDMNGRVPSDIFPDIHEQRISAVLEELSVGIYRTTPEPTNRFLLVNEALASLLGFQSCDELLDTPVTEIYANRKDRRQVLDTLQARGILVQNEVRMRKKDGSGMDALISARAIRGDDGDILWIEGILQRLEAFRAFPPGPMQRESSGPVW